MKQSMEITQEHISIEELNKIIQDEVELTLSEEVQQRVIKCRKYLDGKIKESDDPIYGINTGFGSLYDKNISNDNLEKLQVNLVKSHACGTGDEIRTNVVRLMLFIKIQSLYYGHSGFQLETLQRLVNFFNHGIYPVIYEFGSLGASGDLAPLAHLSLPLIGEGEVNYNGKRYSGKSINQMMNWDPIHFKAKEGLALLNGTQFMSAFGIC